MRSMRPLPSSVEKALTMPGLEDLYREIILDHYRNPRNRGELAVPPAHRVEGFNPLCGDEIVVYVDVEDGRIADLRVGGQGCSISQSSASMMSAAVKGKTVDEARAFTRAFKAMMSIHEHAIAGDGDGDGGAGDAADVKLGDLEALRGVVKFPVRIKCATLSWNTLTQALDEVAAGTASA
jgi:nitrogen fixation NifU-like protein